MPHVGIPNIYNIVEDLTREGPTWCLPNSVPTFLGRKLRCRYIEAWQGGVFW